jgi:hypothetical protein
MSVSSPSFCATLTTQRATLSTFSSDARGESDPSLWRDTTRSIQGEEAQLLCRELDALGEISLNPFKIQAFLESYNGTYRGRDDLAALFVYSDPSIYLIELSAIACRLSLHHDRFVALLHALSPGLMEKLPAIQERYVQMTERYYSALGWSKQLDEYKGEAASRRGATFEEMESNLHYIFRVFTDSATIQLALLEQSQECEPEIAWNTLRDLSEAHYRWCCFRRPVGKLVSCFEQVAASGYLKDVYKAWQAAQGRDSLSSSR